MDEFIMLPDDDCEECESNFKLYDRKCDELREAFEINGKLRLLLSEKGIDHEY